TGHVATVYRTRRWIVYFMQYKGRHGRGASSRAVGAPRPATGGLARVLQGEGALAHLVPNGDDLRVGEAAALPVGAVDDEGVAGYEPGVRGREERRRPSE